MIDGAVVSAAGPVVNRETATGSSLPATSRGSIESVISEFVGSGTCGTIRRFLLLLSNTNVTGTGPAGPDRVTLSAVTDSGLMASLKTRRTDALIPAPVEPAYGTIDRIVGAVVSAADPV